MLEEIKRARDFAWPAGIRLPVVLTFEHQAGEGALSMPGNRPNYRSGDIMQYGARQGIWNILEALEKYSVKATFLFSGSTAQNYPETARAVMQVEHEIAGLGFNFESIHTSSAERERSIVRRTAAVLEDVTGTRIQGWRCPDYRVSPQTHDVLADEGFLWDSSLLNDDLPYLLACGTRRLVEIPFTTSTADKAFVGDPPPQRGGPHGLANAWDSEFALLYEESQRAPRFLILSLQTWASGRPVVLRILTKFLERLSSLQGIWFARCCEIARLLEPNKQRERELEFDVERKTS
jgi:peptidoglycan-N-acetylglucosamine deacetylase